MITDPYELGKRDGRAEMYQFVAETLAVWLEVWAQQRTALQAKLETLTKTDT